MGDRGRDHCERELRLPVARHVRQEAALHASEVGEVVAEPMAVDAVPAPAQGHMHALRHAPLDASYELGIDAHLQERSALGATGQLGIDDLVVVRTHQAFAVDPHEEIDVAKPDAVEERRLVDHVRTRMHQRLSSRRVPLDTLLVGRVTAGVGRDAPVDDLVTELAEIGEEALLVLQSAFLENGELRILPRRPLDGTLERRALEHSQVLALEKPDEVGCRKDDASVFQALHQCVSAMEASLAAHATARLS